MYRLNILKQSISCAYRKDWAHIYLKQVGETGAGNVKLTIFANVCFPATFLACWGLLEICNSWKPKKVRFFEVFKNPVRFDFNWPGTKSSNTFSTMGSSNIFFNRKAIFVFMFWLMSKVFRFLTIYVLIKKNIFKK